MILMSTFTLQHEILRELHQMNEADFRRLIVNFFLRLGHLADDRHGSDERGLDIEVRIDEDHDIINRRSVVYIQVKAVDVGIGEWRRNLCAQLSSLIYRRPINNTIYPVLPKRLLFISSHRICPKVHQEIEDWNARMAIPFESVEGSDFAYLLSQDYTPEQVRNFLEEPPLAPQVQPEIGTLESPATDRTEERDVHFRMIGRADDRGDALA